MSLLIAHVLLFSLQLFDSSTVDFLASMQNPDGSFASANWSDGELARSTLRTTRTAIRAHQLLGLKVPNQDRVMSYLKACYDKESGGFSQEPGLLADPISTSVALMILKELEQPVEPYLTRATEFMNVNTSGFEQVRMVAPSCEELSFSLPNAKVWIEQIEKTRNSDGSFGKDLGRARFTALNEVALSRLGKPVAKEPVVKILNEGQRSDGGWGTDSQPGSDLEACYRVLRLYYRLQSKPTNVEGLHAFIDSCRNPDGGYGRQPKERSSVHGTYYAIILKDWLTQLKYLEPMQWNFDDVAIGSIPEDWVAARALPDPGSRWGVVKSPSAPKGFALKQQSTEGLKRQFNLCICPESARDVQISVEVKALSGVIDQGGGLIWRYQDAKNYYISRWNPLENNLRVYKVVDGIRTQMDTAQVHATVNHWHQLRIVAVGRCIRGYFDDQLLLEVEDDQFPKAGRIGLWTKADAVTEFTELILKSATIGDIEDLQVGIEPTVD